TQHERRLRPRESVQGARLDSADDPRHASMLPGATAMNCDTYLSMLETLPVEELAYGSAREHAANCRDCDRVTQVVAERERNLAMAFGGLYPSVQAGSITARALELSRRRRIALYYRIGLS